jgi:hypothetical protein
MAYFIALIKSHPHRLAGRANTHSETTMNTFEKFYSLLAVTIAVALVTGIIISPELRQFNRLLPASLFGLAVNVGLLFIVLRDIFLRRFDTENKRYLWIVLVLVIWPSVIYYLWRHGFTPRPKEQEPLPFPTNVREK